MPFNRNLVSEDGRLPHYTMGGDGMCAHIKPKNYNTETDEDITVNELGGGSILQGLTLTSDVTYTLPTAASIQAENGFDKMEVGDSFSFYVGNNQAANFDVIIAVNTGITAIGTNNNLTVGPQAGKIFTIVKTGDDTFDLY